MLEMLSLYVRLNFQVAIAESSENILKLCLTFLNFSILKKS